MHNMTLAMRNLNSAVLVKGHSVTHFVNEQIPSKPHATSRTNGALQSSQSAANLLIITKFLQNRMLLLDLIGICGFHRVQKRS